VRKNRKKAGKKAGNCWKKLEKAGNCWKNSKKQPNHISSQTSF